MAVAPDDLLHVAGAAWLVLVVAASLLCPLTWIEDRARERAGLAVTNGFLDHYVAGVFYPHGYEGVARVVLAVVVLTSWTGVVVNAVRASRTAAARSELRDRV